MTSEQRTFLESYLALPHEPQLEVHQFVVTLAHKKKRNTPVKQAKEPSFSVKFGQRSGLFLVDEEVNPSLEAYDQFVNDASPVRTQK